MVCLRAPSVNAMLVCFLLLISHCLATPCAFLRIRTGTSFITCWQYTSCRHVQCKKLQRFMLCAGACFKDQGIQYTCVAGHLVAGNRDSAKRTLAKYACNSYQEVCCQLQPECNSFSVLNYCELSAVLIVCVCDSPVSKAAGKPHIVPHHCSCITYLSGRLRTGKAAPACSRLGSCRRVACCSLPQIHSSIWQLYVQCCW